MVSDNGRVSRTERRAGNRRWWIIGGGLIALFTAIVVAFSLYLSAGAVHWTVKTYAVVDDQSATVTFEVFRPAHTAVVCRAQAIALDFAVVGVKDVTIPADAAGGARTVVDETTIRTTTRANTVTISNCVQEGARSQ